MTSVRLIHGDSPQGMVVHSVTAVSLLLTLNVTLIQVRKISCITITKRYRSQFHPKHACLDEIIGSCFLANFLLL